LLLLDEPAAGMNPEETDRLMSLVKKIRDQGITVLLVEHNMRLVMGISDRILAMDHGCQLVCDSPEKISNDPKVIEAYLGGGQCA
jgi:branched-chain amino acid transport system ATP-binding protein